MTRGVAHPPELRAEVIAAVLAGEPIAQVAARLKVDKSLVWRWTQAELQPIAIETRARTRSQFQELLLDLLNVHIATLRVQLQAAARPEWIEKQSAAELAALVVAERDSLVRLGAGVPPVDERPQLEGPGPPEADT